MKKITTFILVMMFTLISFNGISQVSTWTALSSGTTTNLLGVSAVSSNICYAVGNSGTILKTSNGGLNWTSQSSATTENLYSVCFTDALHGVAVGDGGTVIRTVDGGTNWSSLTVPTGGSPTSASLRNISFYDANIGFIVGGPSGKVFKTTDGGATWVQQTIASSTVVYSSSFTSPTDGYCCDANGAIYKTTNGGTNWILSTSGTTNTLYLMDFANAATGVALGTNGKIVKTTTSGSSWSTIVSGTTDLLCGLKFMDANNGFAVGGDVGANSGTILKTTDGGNTWFVNSPSTSMLYRVDFSDANSGYAVGWDGTILKYYSNVGINEKENNFNLSVFPNPSFSNTTINFNIKENSFIEITLVNELGEILSNIANKQFPQGENKLLINDLEKYPVGNYFICMRSSTYTETKKLTIIK